MAEADGAAKSLLQMAINRFKKPNKPREPKPEDLAYVGVQDTGMARQTADSIRNRQKQIDEATK
jgi:hypothetical protein